MYWVFIVSAMVMVTTKMENAIFGFNQQCLSAATNELSAVAYSHHHKLQSSTISIKGY